MATASSIAEPSEAASGWDDDSHPWRRYGARSIDLTVFGGLFGIVAAVVVGIAAPEYVGLIEAPPPWAEFVILVPLSVVLTSVAVALCHSTWRSTPGKWIFRLRVEDANGCSLSLRQAFLREVHLVWWGFGLGLPLISFFMLLMSYSDLEGGGTTRWDRASEARSLARVIHGAGYVWLVVGAMLVVAAKLLGVAGMFSGLASSAN